MFTTRLQYVYLLLFLNLLNYSESYTWDLVLFYSSSSAIKNGDKLRKDKIAGKKQASKQWREFGKVLFIGMLLLVSNQTNLFSTIYIHTKTIYLFIHFNLVCKEVAECIIPHIRSFILRLMEYSVEPKKWIFFGKDGLLGLPYSCYQNRCMSKFCAFVPSYQCLPSCLRNWSVPSIHIFFATIQG